VDGQQVALVGRIIGKCHALLRIVPKIRDSHAARPEALFHKREEPDQPETAPIDPGIWVIPVSSATEQIFRCACISARFYHYTISITRYKVSPWLPSLCCTSSSRQPLYDISAHILRATDGRASRKAAYWRWAADPDLLIVGSISIWISITPWVTTRVGMTRRALPLERGRQPNLSICRQPAKRVSLCRQPRTIGRRIVPGYSHYWLTRLIL
jgi:hypothetical protein